MRGFGASLSVLGLSAALAVGAWSYFDRAGSATRAGSDAACQGEYAQAARPMTTSPVQLLCFQHFAVGYSPDTLTARWSAERLSGAAVEAGRTIGRAEDFHPDPRLTGEPHPELSDYRRSGFDRGHLTPSADMPNADARDETFSLANIVPQDPTNNRHIWSDIEQTIRRVARQRGAVYVVTGPIFAAQPGYIRGGVAVPVGLFKAVLIPGVGAAAYISENVARRNWRVISIDALNRLAGVDPFPSLGSGARRNPVELPVPYGYHRSREGREGATI